MNDRISFVAGNLNSLAGLSVPTLSPIPAKVVAGDEILKILEVEFDERIRMDDGGDMAWYWGFQSAVNKVRVALGLEAKDST